MMLSLGNTFKRKRNSSVGSMTSRLRAASDLEGELLYFDREKNSGAKVI